MTSPVHAFTSVTTNYMPKARVLAETLKQVDPEVQFTLLLTDDPPADFDLSREPFDHLLFADELPIPDFPGWVFSHRLVEICTAVKGAAVEYLFEEMGAGKVFYFDPDIAVFGRLDELIERLDSASILLTPHQTDPESTFRGIIDNEMCSLRHGVFNLGFIGIANTGEGRRFSRWWRDRLLNFCHDDHARSLFTDQKWVNLAPCMFDELTILRSPGFNVATWNLSTRRATGSIREGIRVNGEPLGFYHFSGFDSGAQEKQLKRYGQESPVLFELRQWYAEALARNGQEELGKRAYKYAFFEDGTPITDDQRLLYRQRADLRETFPDPFKTSGFDRPDLEGGYRAWYDVHIQPPGQTAVQVAPETTIRAFLQSSGDYLEQRALTAQFISPVKRRGLCLLASLLRGTARFAS